MKAKKNGAQSTPEFLSTHPHDDTRIADLRKYLPEAKRLAAQYNAKARLLKK